MKRLFIAILVGLAGAFSPAFSQSSGVATPVQFTISFRVSSGLPPSVGLELGSGTAILAGNVFSFCFTNFSPLFIPVSAAIYGSAAVGANGNLIVASLPQKVTPPGRVTFTGAYTLTPAQTAQVQAGLWYVIVDSRPNAYGTLRGQIVPVPAAKPQPVTGGVYGQSQIAYELSEPPPIFTGDPGTNGDIAARALRIPAALPADNSFPIVWTPYTHKIWVSIYGTNGLLVTRVIGNPVGQFYAYMKPGDYVILGTPTDQSLPPRNLSRTQRHSVTLISLFLWRRPSASRSRRISGRKSPSTSWSFSKRRAVVSTARGSVIAHDRQGIQRASPHRCAQTLCHFTHGRAGFRLGRTSVGP